MNKSEFENRVQMSVTANEYAAIEEVYMNSDLDKDDFCKMWVKMNQSRVNKAKDEAKAQAKEAAKREALYEIINRDWSNLFERNAAAHLTKQQRLLLDEVGINLMEHRYSIPYFKTVSTIIYEIKEYLKVA
ncbi:MAG: hypothetical protein IJ064_05675 [Bacteroidaceae bacterium]|nr:hypothetical protein [Bacteroidaceae bacterium]